MFYRIWSDGFQIKPLNGHNVYNGIQLYTLTVLSSPGNKTKHHTLPLALCYKKLVDSGVFATFLENYHELMKVREVYFGRENKVFHTMAIMELVENNLPERCDNTCICYKGKLTTRFGYSCDVTDPSKSICDRCEIQLIDNYLHDIDEPVPNCKVCNMWGSQCRIFPIADDVETVAKTDHIARLGFDQLLRAAQKVQEYAAIKRFNELNRTQSPPVKTVIEEFLRKSGFSPNLISILIKALKDGINILQSDLLPRIWTLCVEFGFSLEQFPCLPMHLLLLGIEKNLLSQTPVIYDRKRCVEDRSHWTDLTDHMAYVHTVVKELGLEWCVSMPFTGILKVGSSGWESKHYVAFSRVSLVFYAQLHNKCNQVNEVTNRILLAFKSVRVLWFCLLSRIMTDDDVESTEVDYYAKVFLSACKRFHQCADNRFQQKAEEENSESRKKTASTKKKKNNKQPRQKKKATPFFVSAANYQCLPNLKEQIDLFGSMRNYWEGGSEAFINMSRRSLLP